MSDYFIGEIRLFPYDRIPEDWVLCDGRDMTIQNNAALFSLLGITFGGDAKATFKLPDLRGRVPLGAGYNPSQQWWQQGISGGSEAVTLNTAQIPAHTHAIVGNNTGDTTTNAGQPTANAPGTAIARNTINPVNIYAVPATPPAATDVFLEGGSLSNAGGSTPHNNVQPSLALNYCIATRGLYPSRP